MGRFRNASVNQGMGQCGRRGCQGGRPRVRLAHLGIVLLFIERENTAGGVGLREKV